MQKDYTTFVYKDSDNWVVAKDNTGKIIDESNTTPETVIKTAVDRAGKLKLRGDISLSPAFTGFKLKSHTLLDYGPESWLRVPNGYTGDLWIFDYTYQGSTIFNVSSTGILNVAEQGGTPGYNWDAVGLLLKDPGSPGSSGICFCDIGNMNVNNAKSAINIDLQHTGGWITSCNFEKIKVWTTRRAIQFENTIGTTSIPGISSNNFKHIWMQSSSVNDYGVKDVIGKNLWFIDVSIWDLQSSNDGGGLGTGHASSFTPYCGDIFVQGGIMMYYNLQNNAPKGKVHFMDAHTTLQAWNWQYFEDPTLLQANGSATGSRVYTFAHGMNYTPKWIDIIPKSDDSMTSPIRWSWDSTNVIITFQGTPPPPATAGNQNNVKFQMRVSGN